MPIIAGPGDPGSTLDLCAIFINVAADPADFMSFRYAGRGFSVDTAAVAEIRQLVNRRRLITRGAGQPGAPMVAESQQITLSKCDREQVAWLKGHAGTLVCLRDHVGGKFYGAYLALPRNVETRTRDRIEVTLNVEQVTHSEAV